MQSGRNKLYFFLLLFCLAGYIWFYTGYRSFPESGDKARIGCLIKHTTNVPCPSCGATRSAISLIKGDFAGSLYWNPIGILLVCMGVIIPIWISYDKIFRKDSLYLFYRKAEVFLRRKAVALPAILLIIINWIWNIYKGL